MQNEKLTALVEANEKAKNALKTLRKGEKTSFSEICYAIRNFVGHKFMLSQSDFRSENLIELAKMSLAKRLEIPFSKIGNVDIADCSGATSSMTKKVLLIMAIEKELGLNFSGEESSKIDTITDLCQQVAQKKG